MLISKYRASLDCPYEQLKNDLDLIIKVSGKYDLQGYGLEGNSTCSLAHRNDHQYQLYFDEVFSRFGGGYSQGVYFFIYRFSIHKEERFAEVIGEIRLKRSQLLFMLVAFFLFSLPLLFTANGWVMLAVVTLIFSVLFIVGLISFKSKALLALNHIGNRFRGE